MHLRRVLNKEDSKTKIPQRYPKIPKDTRVCRRRAGAEASGAACDAVAHHQHARAAENEGARGVVSASNKRVLEKGLFFF